MGLQYVKGALKTEVRSEKNVSRFNEAKTRHPALASHQTVYSVLAVLGDDSDRGYAAKEALTRALVAEYQQRPHGFWAAVLLAAYYPMLSRLRGRIFGDAVAPDDLDQVVVTAFLDVLYAFPLAAKRDRICMYLRQMTQRAVFRHVREVQQEQGRIVCAAPEELTEFGPVEWPEPRGPRGRPTPERGEADALASLLLQSVGHEVCAAKLDLVIATVLRGERLRAYVDRTEAGRPEEDRERIYQRLKRQRTRTLERLQAVLGRRFCPRQEGGEPLPSWDSVA